MEHGDPLPPERQFCTHGEHGTNPATLGTQNDKFDSRCPLCILVHVTGEHDHLHDEPPYKVGCPQCSSRPLVRCRCGQYH